MEQFQTEVKQLQTQMKQLKVNMHSLMYNDWTLYESQVGKLYSATKNGSTM